MSTSDEWINVINTIENSTRIFLTISIRFLVFCGVFVDVAGWITRCRLNRKIKDKLTLSRCLLTRWKKGLGIAWELDLPFTAFRGRQTAKLKILLEKTFWRSSKLLNLVGQTVNYGALNGLIIVHVVTERFNKWFYLIIYAFNDLKIPDQIHHCTRTSSMIILWQTVSSNILRIYFSSSKISTCLRNNETWWNVVRRKKSIIKL